MLGQSDSDKKTPGQSEEVDLEYDTPTPGLYHRGDTGSHVANPDPFVFDA